MAQAGNQDLTERFIQFYRNYYREEIGTLAQRYPNEQRSLYVEYDDLFQFDRDLAEDFRTKPDQMREYAEEALRLYDLPADVSLSARTSDSETSPRTSTSAGSASTTTTSASWFRFRGSSARPPTSAPR